MSNNISSLKWSEANLCPCLLSPALIMEQLLIWPILTNMALVPIKGGFSPWPLVPYTLSVRHCLSRHSHVNSLLTFNLIFKTFFPLQSFMYLCLKFTFYWCLN